MGSLAVAMSDRRRCGPRTGICRTSALLASETGAFLFVWRVTPEIQGKTLEEIEWGRASACYCNRKLNATVSRFSTACPSSSAG